MHVRSADAERFQGCCLVAIVLSTCLVFEILGKPGDGKVAERAPGIYLSLLERDLQRVSGGLSCQRTVYDAPYSHATTSADIDKSDAKSSPFVLVGAKSSEGFFEIAAIGPYDLVFQETASSSSALHGGGGAYWYRYSGRAFGFAPSALINLASAADAEMTDCEKRLSWHLDNDLGGWSAGCSRGMWDSEWRKVVMYCGEVDIAPSEGGLWQKQNVNSGLTLLRIETHTPNSDEVSGPPIRVGTALTLDCCAALSDIGLALKRAYLLFATWLNTVRGGIRVGSTKRLMSLTFINDQSERDLVATITKYLVEQEGIQLLFGPPGSSQTARAALISNSSDTVMIATEQLPVKGYFEDKAHPGVFETALTDSRYFSAVWEQLEARGARTVVVMEERGLSDLKCDSALWVAARHRMSIIHYYILDSDVIFSDHRIFDDAAAQPPDVVLGCIASEQICHNFMREVEKRSFYASAFVLTSCVAGEDWLEKLGEAGQYVIGAATPWTPSHDVRSEITNWTAYDFDVAYSSMYNSRPPYQAASAWATAEILVAAIEKAGSEDTAGILNALRDMSVNTVYGAVAFDYDGRNANFRRVVQYHPGSDKPHIIIPSWSGAPDLIYPVPQWSIRPCLQYPGATGICSLGLRQNGECGQCLERECVAWQQNVWEGMPACACVECSCTAGRILNQSTATCIACPVGKYANPSSQACVACERGSFADGEGQSACTLCPEGRAANTTGQSFCQLCPAGMAVQSPGASLCERCHRGTYAQDIGSSTCIHCPPGMSAVGEGADRCVPCPAGQTSERESHRCSDCPVGKYAPSAGMPTCVECPPGTACHDLGTAVPDNLENWFRVHVSGSDIRNDQWLPCKGEICKRGERCADGHAGFLCEVCLPGYHRGYHAEECTQCSDWYIQLIMFIVVTPVLITLVWITVATAVHPSFVNSKAIADTYLKLLFNHMTTISVIATLLDSAIRKKELEYRSQGTSLLDAGLLNAVNSALSFSFSNTLAPMFSSQCVFQPALSESDQSWVSLLMNTSHAETLTAELQNAQGKLKDYHSKMMLSHTIFWLASPLILVGVALFFGFLYLLISLALQAQKNRNVINFLDNFEMHGFQGASKGMTQEAILHCLESHRQLALGLYPRLMYTRLLQSSKVSFLRCFLLDSVPVAVVSGFLSYPITVRMLLEPLRCEKSLRPEDGELHSSLFMAASPDLKCYNGEDMAFLLAMIAILVFVIIVPISGGCALYRRWQLNTLDENDAAHVRAWGFLTNCYRVGATHWECLLLFRKSLAEVVVVFGYNESLQAFLLLLLASGSALLHGRAKPFEDYFNNSLNRIEARYLSLWVCLSLLFVWVHLDNPENPGSSRLGTMNDYLGWIAMIIFAVHCIFLAIIVWRVFMQVSFGCAYDAMTSAAERSRIRGSLAYHEVMIQGHGNEQRGVSIVETPDRARALDQPSSLVSASNDASKQQFAEVKKGRSEMLINWRWMYYLENQPHLFVKPDRMWFQILGKSSGSLQARSAWRGRCKNLSLVKQNPSAYPARSWERRHMLQIFMDAFECIIVDSGIELFPVSLIEFVIRVGLAFDSDGNFRRYKIDAPESQRTQAVDTSRAWMHVHGGAAGVNVLTDGLPIDIAAAFHKSLLASGSTHYNKIAQRASQVHDDHMQGDFHGDFNRASNVNHARRSSIVPSRMSNEMWGLPSISLAAAHTELPSDQLAHILNEMLNPKIFQSSIAAHDLEGNLHLLRAMSQSNLHTLIVEFDQKQLLEQARRIHNTVTYLSAQKEHKATSLHKAPASRLATGIGMMGLQKSVTGLSTSLRRTASAVQWMAEGDFSTGQRPPSTAKLDEGGDSSDEEKWNDLPEDGKRNQEVQVTLDDSKKLRFLAIGGKVKISRPSRDRAKAKPKTTKRTSTMGRISSLNGADRGGLRGSMTRMFSLDSGADRGGLRGGVTRMFSLDKEQQQSGTLGAVKSRLSSLLGRAQIESTQEADVEAVAVTADTWGSPEASLNLGDQHEAPYSGAVGKQLSIRSEVDDEELGKVMSPTDRWAPFVAQMLLKVDVLAARLPAERALQRFRSQEKQISAKHADAMANLEQLRKKAAELQNHMAHASFAITKQLERDKPRVRQLRQENAEAHRKIEELRAKLEGRPPRDLASIAAAGKNLFTTTSSAHISDAGNNLFTTTSSAHISDAGKNLFTTTSSAHISDLVGSPSNPIKQQSGATPNPLTQQSAAGKWQADAATAAADELRGRSPSNPVARAAPPQQLGSHIAEDHDAVNSQMQSAGVLACGVKSFSDLKVCAGRV